MLYYNKPIMGMYLAETMLNEHYRAHKKRKELAELKHFAREASVKDSRLWGKILFRIMKQETNYILVDMVIRSLPQDWQSFVDLKYRRKERVIKQTEMLHVSSSQLGIWNSAIKLNVLNALQYRLTLNDVFLRTKIINMLEKIDMLISENNSDRIIPHFPSNTAYSIKIKTPLQTVFVEDEMSNKNEIHIAISKNNSYAKEYIVKDVQLINHLIDIINTSIYDEYSI